MIFSENDSKSLEKQGIKMTEVIRQIDCFRKGQLKLHIVRPASINDGILVCGDKATNYVHLFREEKQHYSVTKFVPASGAASRMFKSLFGFRETGKKDSAVIDFFSHLNHFVFSRHLEKISGEREKTEYLLSEKGLNFGFLPKALIPFYLHNNKEFTPLHSHLYEAAELGKNNNKNISVHFTLSPEHVSLTEKLSAEIQHDLTDKFNTTIAVHTSTQNKNTDTIAADENNQPVRTEKGELLFRPAGHGALLQNLQSIKSDLIFIRNIDNVLPPARMQEGIFLREMMGGLFISLQKKLFVALDRLASGENIKTSELVQLCSILSLKAPENLLQDTGGKEWYSFLNRPLRVCGMVKNEGQPGGGPFWVKGKNGTESLQIVESAQFLPEQGSILHSSTHFNPNDMVCSFKSHKGEYFNLSDFADPDTYFISSKSYNGKSIKALELPGLWNGSMSGWITVFVEIPAAVFNPVKTINDLLKESHRQ